MIIFPKLISHFGKISHNKKIDGRNHVHIGKILKQRMVDEFCYFVFIPYVIIFDQFFCNIDVGDGAHNFAKPKFKIKNSM